MPIESFPILTKETFDTYTNSHDGIVIFHKKICPHCKIMGTVLDKMNAIAPAAVASVDFEEEPELKARMNVERVPTLFAIKGGEVRARFVGIMNPRETAAWYQKA